MPNKQIRSPEKFAHHVMLLFFPYGDLLDQAFSQFNEKSISNQDPHSQIENDETPEADYPNENDSEDTETKLLQFLTLCHKYYQMMNLQKSYISQIQSKGKSSVWFIHGLKIL